MIPWENKPLTIRICSLQLDKTMRRCMERNLLVIEG